MHRLTLLLLLALGTGFIWTNGSAGDPVSGANHYKVYEVPETFTVTGELRLDDQFGSSLHTFVLLDKFANPVDKNSGGIFDDFIHQTWWEIDDPQVPRTLEVENQFGTQTWIVGDGQYLVLPATKNIVPPQPPPTDVENHYKCYDAVGPLLDTPVVLRDQFGLMTATVTAPKFLCNPVTKTFEGQVFPIVVPDRHLACYQIEPPMTVMFPLLATDQFGPWNLTAVLPEWLCVPSLKREPVPTENSTWGEVKSIYR